MNLKRRDEEDVTVLELSGKLMGGPDAVVFGDTIKELIGAGRTAIVADLEKLSWVNSTGLGILISGYTSAKNAGGVMKLAAVASRIESILMITKLTTVFETFKTVDEAVASFRNG